MLPDLIYVDFVYLMCPHAYIHTASSYRKVDCSVNKLAELNRRSCTPAVRAAAEFFLEKDAIQGLCK